MCDDNIIEIKGLKKIYKLGVINTGTLGNDLKTWYAKKKGKLDPNEKIESQRLQGDVFYALNGIDLKIKRGEAVGIIGGNGAGKSTLLKMISRVSSPTEGEIILRGRVTSMLEVGTGFNGELTGRENIYMNGAILGMSKKEIDSKIEQIIDFSECREFIDTPVKRYSSGMYVKLAFAVAANLDNDIMIMDEVLAVGDVAFQKKCINKMIDTIHDDNKTVLYVSHNMATVKALCTRCVVLKDGKIIFDGNPSEAIAIYSGADEEVFLTKSFETVDWSNHRIFINDVLLLNRDNLEFIAGENVELEMNWGSNDGNGDIVVGVTIYKGSQPIATSFTQPFRICPNQRYKTKLDISTDNLVTDKYNIHVSFYRYKEPDLEELYTQSDFFVFNINVNKLQGNLNWRSDMWGEFLLPSQQR